MSSAFAHYRNIEIQACALTLNLCSNSIQKALKRLPFVAGVRTELKSNTFNLYLRPGTTPDSDMILHSVEIAGFSGGNITMKVKFSPVDIIYDISKNWIVKISGYASDRFQPQLKV
jgi:copper chaperone CopZ